MPHGARWDASLPASEGAETGRLAPTSGATPKRPLQLPGKSADEQFRARHGAPPFLVSGSFRQHPVGESVSEIPRQA
jgi:hypothetical protein